MTKKSGDILFGEFLIEKGIVDEQAILDALDRQRKLNIPIGQLALKERKLTVKQVFHILNVQIDNKKLFGAIAVELGYITPEDVETLLTIQQDKRPRLGDILVEMKKINDSAKEILHSEFEKRQPNS